MRTGKFTDKAKPLMVYFVFSCILLITGLLYAVQQTERIGDLSSLAQLGQYLN